MRSSKSRSRNKSRNRPQGGGNIVNRVFDSSGPEGKVRGTPAQIIEKYNQLARDAQLSSDRVALENFQQHSEHYTRMLAAAQKEIDARQQQGGHQQNQPQHSQHDGGQGGGQQGHRNNNGQNGGNHGGDGQTTGGQGGNEPRQQNEAQSESRSEPDKPRAPRVNRRRDRSGDGDARGDARATDAAAAPTDVVEPQEGESNLVETPENAAADAKPVKPRRTRTRKKAPAPAEGEQGDSDTMRTDDSAA